MVIEVNGIEYQDARAAKKAMAKAEKAERAEREKQDKNRATARLYACESLATIISELGFRAENGPERITGWSRVSPDRIIRENTTYHVESAKFCVVEYYSTFESVRYEHYGVKPAEILENAAGQNLAVKLVDTDPPVSQTSINTWYAIGVFSGEVYFLAIPAFIAEHIEKIKFWER